MLRLTIFIIALLLVAGAIEPTHGWLVAIAVLSGLSLFRIRPWRWIEGPPRRWTRWSRESDW